MEDQGDRRNAQLSQLVRDSGLRSLTMVAWRDLDDPEAGGSELHAHRIATRWAAAGLDLTMRTSHVANAPEEVTRDGYRSIRKHGRYAVFPHVMAEGFARRSTSDSAVVEIWNGMPFLSPIWHRGPKLIFFHHVHADMWDMVLSPKLARGGKALESSLAPPLYKRSTIATLSESSRQEIIDMLGIPPLQVHVIAPGVEERFTPGGTLSPSPKVVAVGRLVPVKRFDVLIRELVATREFVPDLTATIIGEGYERSALESLRDSLGASDWISLPGRLSDDEQLAAYRSAWVVASTSAREGWGMTLTEAAACGTPSVATDIAGHQDAVRHGTSGLLVGSDELFSRVLANILTDSQLREKLSAGALAYAKELSWDSAALRTFSLLAATTTS